MTLSENDELEGGHGIIASEWQEAGASLGEGFRLMLQLVTVQLPTWNNAEAGTELTTSLHSRLQFSRD